MFKSTLIKLLADPDSSSPQRGEQPPEQSVGCRPHARTEPIVHQPVGFMVVTEKVAHFMQHDGSQPGVTGRRRN